MVKLICLRSVIVPLVSRDTALLARRKASVAVKGEGKREKRKQESSPLRLLPCSLSVPPHHADDDALHDDVFRRGNNWLDGGVRGLETNAAVLAIELLERDVGPVEHRDDHFAVVGRAAVLDDDEVAVPDLFVDHRVPLDAEDVGVALAHEVFGYGDGLVANYRFDRHARGDVAEERQLERAAAGLVRYHFD